MMAGKKQQQQQYYEEAFQFDPCNWDFWKYRIESSKPLVYLRSWKFNGLPINQLFLFFYQAHFTYIHVCKYGIKKNLSDKDKRWRAFTIGYSHETTSVEYITL